MIGGGIEGSVEGHRTSEAANDFLNCAEARGAIEKESDDEACGAALVSVPRGVVQPPRLSAIGELERLRVAQHHADRDPHGLDHFLEEPRFRRQTSATQIADELQAPGAAVLRLQGIFNGFNDYLEQHAA